MGTREILTLQFGHYSNFVGTHWWNIQELGFEYDAGNSIVIPEINYDVLYREGVTDHGQTTFTPRLLLVDLKGSLKTLPENGELYGPLVDPQNVSVAGYKNLEIQKQTRERKSKYQEDLQNTSELVCNKTYNLDNEVKVWSDFLYSRFHPRTVNIIKQYQHCNEHTPFDAFPLGTSLWKSPQFGDDFCDKVRNYIEECDSFQGFHILSDCTNAFSGFSSECLEYLNDEYERKPALTFPLIPSHFSDNIYQTDEEKQQSQLNDSVRVLNLALSFNAYNSFSSLFVPMCTGKYGWRQPGPSRQFYHTQYNHELPYHSSAILASALDTLTMKHRLMSGGFSLIDLCVDLNFQGRKAAAASVCLPFSLNVDADLLDCLDNWQGPLTQCITPNCTIGSDRIMQHMTLRGIPEDRLKRSSTQAGKQRDLPAYNCKTIQEMLEFYLSCSTHATASNVTVVHKPMSVKPPYPNIFDTFIGQNGNVCADPRPQNTYVESIPIVTGIHSGSGVGDMIESLHSEADKLKFHTLNHFYKGGLEKDDVKECLSNLCELRESYEDNYYL